MFKKFYENAVMAAILGEKNNIFLEKIAARTAISIFNLNGVHIC